MQILHLATSFYFQVKLLSTVTFQSPNSIFPNFVMIKLGQVIHLWVDMYRGLLWLICRWNSHGLTDWKCRLTVWLNEKLDTLQTNINFTYNFRFTNLNLFFKQKGPDPPFPNTLSWNTQVLSVPLSLHILHNRQEEEYISLQSFHTKLWFQSPVLTHTQHGVVTFNPNCASAFTFLMWIDVLSEYGRIPYHFTISCRVFPYSKG